MSTPTEITQYYSLGYDAKTGQVQYVFVNPFRTPENEDNDDFQDHIRSINVVMDGATVDVEATEVRAGEVARGVFNKMKLKADAYVPEGAEADVIAAFGELPEPPAAEAPAEEEAPAE